MLVPARETGKELVRPCPGTSPFASLTSLMSAQFLRTADSQVDVAARLQHAGKEVRPLPDYWGRPMPSRQVAQAGGQSIVSGSPRGQHAATPLALPAPAAPLPPPPGACLIEQIPDMLRPVLHGLPRKRPVRVLDLVAPGNHQGQLDGRRVQAEFPQRQGPLIVGVGGSFQRIDAGSGQLELGLVIREDPRGRIDGRLDGMLPQDPEAEGVNGADDGVIDLRPVMRSTPPS